MRTEWRYLHDVMAESMTGLVSFIQERFGEDSVAEAWTRALSKGWRRDTGKILERDRREIVDALAATWRAHSGSGTGPNPGAFTVEEDDEKFTFSMNPCGSGQRLWRNGAYRGENAFGVTIRGHDWSYGRAGYPLYCTHCTFMNESLPINWYGLPLYPSGLRRTSTTTRACGTGTRTPRTSRACTGSATAPPNLQDDAQRLRRRDGRRPGHRARDCR